MCVFLCVCVCVCVYVYVCVYPPSYVKRKLCKTFNVSSPLPCVLHFSSLPEPPYFPSRYPKLPVFPRIFFGGTSSRGDQRRPFPRIPPPPSLCSLSALCLQRQDAHRFIFFLIPPPSPSHRS